MIGILVVIIVAGLFLRGLSLFARHPWMFWVCLFVGVPLFSWMEHSSHMEDLRREAAERLLYAEQAVEVARYGNILSSMGYYREDDCKDNFLLNEMLTRSVASLRLVESQSPEVKAILANPHSTREEELRLSTKMDEEATKKIEAQYHIEAVSSEPARSDAEIIRRIAFEDSIKDHKTMEGEKLLLAQSIIELRQHAIVPVEVGDGTYSPRDAYLPNDPYYIQAKKCIESHVNAVQGVVGAE